MTYSINDQTKKQLRTIRRGILLEMFNIHITIRKGKDGNPCAVVCHHPFTETERNNSSLMDAVTEITDIFLRDTQKEFGITQ